MPSITISGTVVDFPDTASSPDWSESIIQFAQLVEAALSTVVGPYDVVAQSFAIDAYNPGTDVTVPNLAFSTATVRAAFIKYSCERSTDDNTVYEAGQIIIVYNAENPVGNKWEIVQERVGDADIALAITDDGQFEITTTAISGLNHAGNLTYSASALAQ